jgi:hypothetical protein
MPKPMPLAPNKTTTGPQGMVLTAMAPIPTRATSTRIPNLQLHKVPSAGAALLLVGAVANLTILASAPLLLTLTRSRSEKRRRLNGAPPAAMLQPTKLLLLPQVPIQGPQVLLLTMPLLQAGPLPMPMLLKLPQDLPQTMLPLSPLPLVKLQPILFPFLFLLMKKLVLPLLRYHFFTMLQMQLF